MERWVLADTSAIVGLFMEDDEWHEQATEVLEELRVWKKRMLTTWDVFDEVVTSLGRRAGYGKAIQAGEAMKGSQLLKLVSVDDWVRNEAWEAFRKYRFPNLSFTDCTSVKVMEKYGIREAFTFDEHFKKVGCIVIPEGKS